MGGIQVWDGDSEVKLRKEDWEVRPCPVPDGKALVKEHHYAKGGSRVAVYMHGLYRKSDGKLCGVAWWLPPTKVAAQSVNRENWTRVLSLTRLVITPDVPSNGASFLLGKSIKMIRKEGKYVSLVTYADEFMGHTGGIYKATNWTYVGLTGAEPRWEDSEGRQVARKNTRTRRNAEMVELGYRFIGRFRKHKYVMHLR